MDKLCPFCHESIPEHQYRAHVAQHTALQKDGQMTDHVTVAPEKRYQGDLHDTPRWYRHEKCGAVTGMPEEIIRSYLVDPFLYSDYTFCTGCGKYPHASEFHWTETGENLLAYSNRLRLEYIQRNHLNPNDFVWRNGAPVRRKRKLGPAVLLGGCLVVAVVMVGLFIVAGVGMAAFVRRVSQPKTALPPTAPTALPAPAFPGSSFDPSRDPAWRTEDMQRRVQQQQDDIRRRHEEMRRRHEEMMERMRGGQ